MIVRDCGKAAEKLKGAESAAAADFGQSGGGKNQRGGGGAGSLARSQEFERFGFVVGGRAPNCSRPGAALASHCWHR